MSQLQSPTPGFLFAAVLFRKDLHQVSDLIAIWEKKWGAGLPFFHSYCPMKRYYAKEMGPESDLDRFFILTPILVKRESLVSAKHWSQALEKKYEQNNARQVNWDVGILTLENLQLATGKNFTHRVYLGEGIFSDLTLIYQKGDFNALDWSYPDYSHPEIKHFFCWAREILHLKLKEIPPGRK